MEAETKISHIQNKFQAHNGHDGQGSVLTALNFPALHSQHREGNFGFLVQPPVDDHINENAQKQQEQGNVVGKENERKAFVGAKHQAKAQNACNDELPEFEAVTDDPGPVSHIQHDKAEQKAEAIGDHISEVEAVPDIVKLADQHAEHEENQQKDAANLVPKLYFFCGKEQEAEHDSSDTAIQVRQALFQAVQMSTADIAGDLTHTVHDRIEAFA